MLKHVWSVLCSRSIIDKDTNNITLLEVLEQVTLGRRPPGGEGLLAMSVELVTFWTRQVPNEPTQGRTRSSFVRPSGLLQESIEEHEIDLRTVGRNRHRHKYAGIPILEAGRHIFQVELWNDGQGQWEEVAAVPLEIVFPAD